MAATQLSYTGLANPLTLVEKIASDQDWIFERATQDELTVTIAGTWADYHIAVNWRDDLEALHLACAFEFRIPDARMSEVYKLVAQINEQLWLGHFDLWSHEGLLMYRHSLMLNNAVATPSQCEALIQAALEACERYYQAFQYVAWAGKDAKKALAVSMFETEGQA